jgi:glycosyltransferase involved in cell wall biosynthesis
MVSLKISIITVAYNSEKYIQRCFDSIKDQTENVYEHLIVDGNSTDKTCTIINRYIQENDNFKKIFISEDDDGIYDAMNKGLKLATGDYVWFLNSDDRLASTDVISDVKSILDKNPATMLAGTTGIRNEFKLLRIYTAKQKTKSFIPQQPHPSLLINLKFLKDMGISFDSSKKIVSDYKMQLEVYKNGGSLYVCSNVFSEMYVGGVSNSSLKYKIMGWIESYVAYKEVFGSGALTNTLLKIFTKFPQYLARLRVF